MTIPAWSEARTRSISRCVLDPQAGAWHGEDHLVPGDVAQFADHAHRPMWLIPVEPVLNIPPVVGRRRPPPGAGDGTVEGLETAVHRQLEDVCLPNLKLLPIVWKRKRHRNRHRRGT